MNETAPTILLIDDDVELGGMLQEYLGGNGISVLDDFGSGGCHLCLNSSRGGTFRVLFFFGGGAVIV